MNKYLPVFLFAICIAIAVILAWTVPSSWPAAVAIALSGSALALALRLQDSGNETADLMEDLSALQAADADLRAELANTRSMIDDLADVVEQIASVAVDTGSGASQEQFEALRGEIGTLRSDTAALQSRTVTAEPDPAVLYRLSLVESRLENMVGDPQVASIEPQPTLAELAATENEPTVQAESQGDAAKLRSLIARSNGQIETSHEPTPNTDTPDSDSGVAVVSLTPLFQPTLGAPVAFMVKATPDEDVASVAPLFHHAVKIANELEGAGKDVNLFVRMSALSLAHLTVRRDVLDVISATPALQRRLTIITPQEGFDDSAQNTLAAFADHGCKFALDGVRDWSMNLSALARAGLGYIVVDGVAMARSAEEQGGDPRRLAQALAQHDISLIAGGVYIRDDIDTVRALEPALVMGDGLGIPRNLED